jgi:hypothetical protein
VFDVFDEALVSDHDPLDFVERHRVAGAVVEFGRPNRSVGGHPLGMLQRSTIFKIGRDARRSKCVAADVVAPDSRPSGRLLFSKNEISIGAIDGRAPLDENCGRP